MASVKITISLPEEVAEQVRAAADKEHVSVSAWLSEAAEQWARVQAARELVHEYEAEHGAFTPEEDARFGAELAAARAAVWTKAG